MVMLTILFLYKMFISPRQVIVTLEKASSGILVADSPDGGGQPSNRTGTSQGRPTVASPHHYWGRYLTLSLAVLSTILSFMLGWDYTNNVYAQEWVAKKIEEVGLIAFAIVMGTILLPLAAIVLIGFMARDEDSSTS